MVVLLDGDKQIVPLRAVHEIWDQRVVGVEQLVPDLPERVVTVQSFDRKAYGMRWVADDNQNIREELARREDDGAPLLRCGICGNATDVVLDVVLNASSHANGCGALRRGARPSCVHKRVKKSSNCFTTVTA